MLTTGVCKKMERSYLKSIHKTNSSWQLMLMLTCCGEDSPMFMLPFSDSMRGVTGRGLISGGGANMSWPVSSLNFESESCFFSCASSLSRVPLSSRCLATSGKVTGFLGETLSSSLKEIWLIPAIACYKNSSNEKNKLPEIQCTS